MSASHLHYLHSTLYSVNPFTLWSPAHMESIVNRQSASSENSNAVKKQETSTLLLAQLC